MICVTAPLAPEPAWEVEAHLLRIFEYADYSLRAALSGAYAPDLECVFSMARAKGVLTGAAGALYGRQNPAVAILGPVGVREADRRRGIGTAMVAPLLDVLGTRGCEAVYLGVSLENPAGRLYRRLGFARYRGIVHRRLLRGQADWEQTHFAPSARVGVRRAHWGDFPGVQALLSCPGLMLTVDATQGIFSSRYVEPARFLGLFPTVMTTCRRQGGLANVLVSTPRQSVVGFAYVYRLFGAAQQHIAQLEFYLHDNFLDHAELLARATTCEAATLPVRRFRCLCLRGDNLRRRAVERLGGLPVATLPESTCIDERLEDTVIYEWSVKGPSCLRDI